MGKTENREQKFEVSDDKNIILYKRIALYRSLVPNAGTLIVILSSCTLLMSILRDKVINCEAV
jgi:hypothetical protein